ncbi:MAG TPA: methionyl-tRNA formyltransferase [Candidatus Saccharimonadales bacterium]|jgi:methionyl-tRNA formyltransferase|nr:methionyl-tRNA formyltransferase [Candidatus Saccharimonadales bacterium]
MMNTSQKIVFFGTEDFSLTALTGLIEAGYTVAAVVTKPDSKKGRGQQLIAPAVKTLASRFNIPVWQPANLNDIADDIKTLGPVAGVLVSYGKIVPQSIIDLFTPGIINVHPSLLPKYRGPSPIESAIINGDAATGVTIMQLAAKMDAGPIYAAKEHPLQGVETRPELYHALADIGTNLLLETLPRILDGSLEPILQNDDAASYSHLLRKTDADLNLASLTATQAERRIRAHIGFPKSKITLLNQSIIITKAHVSDQQKTPLDVIFQDGAYLCIDELIAPSGRRMNAEAFLNGYAA